MTYLEQLLNYAQNCISSANTVKITEKEIEDLDSQLKEAEDFAVKIKEQISLRKKAHGTFGEELNAEIKNMEKVYEIVQEDLKTLQKEIEKILKSGEKNDRLFELLDQESLTIRKMNLAEERVGLKLTVKPERKVGKVSIQ